MWWAYVRGRAYIRGGGAYSRMFTVFALREGEITVFEPKVVIFTARIINTSIYKICELHKAIFSSFYNI